MARVSKTSPFRTRGQAQSRPNARGQQREERPPEPQADENNSSGAEENAQRNRPMVANRGRQSTRRISDIYADERSTFNAVGRANISAKPTRGGRGRRPYALRRSSHGTKSDTSPKPVRGGRGRRPYALRRSSHGTKSDTSPKPVRGGRGRRPYALRRSSHSQRPIMKDLIGDVNFEFVQRNADKKGKGKRQEETDVLEDLEEACKRIKKERKSDDDSDDSDGFGGGGGYGAHSNASNMGSSEVVA